MKKRDAFRVLFAVLIIAVLMIPFASRWPDGLEKIAGELGFAEKEKTPVFHSPFAGYRFPGVQSEFISTALVAILAGSALFLLVWGLAAFLRRKARSEE